MSTTISRRGLLKGIALAGAGASAPGSALFAKASGTADEPWTG